MQIAGGELGAAMKNGCRLQPILGFLTMSRIRDVAVALIVNR